jgi:glycosyltransferase involved in cell wall biosynthesis
LAEVMWMLPDIRLIVVARANSIAGIDFPTNVEVLVDQPGPETWRIVADSRGMVIPLKTDATVCGHITLVGTQKLGVPVVVTRSKGIADYVEDGVTAVLVEAGNAAALREGILRLDQDRAAVEQMAAAGQRQSLVQNDLGVWVDYFIGLKARLKS